MSEFRYRIGQTVMCNLGPKGWQLGRIIAMHYREAHWPAEHVAPYQVLLEADHGLIYVPEDDARFCRAATSEDVMIARRMDALAECPPQMAEAILPQNAQPTRVAIGDGLRRGQKSVEPGDAYRSGWCQCCDPCPQHWSNVELYSEHYRCAARNQLKVTRHGVDLGTLTVGSSIEHNAAQDGPAQQGYSQAPTLVRLPPGLAFSDSGALSGVVAFDPHQPACYQVDFVAVSTAHWNQPAIGLVRLEIRFTVEGNTPPVNFDMKTFATRQDATRKEVRRILEQLYDAWALWEQRMLSNGDTCKQMITKLGQLRAVLEKHPRLDGGRWWVQLGGLHMNVHKLLENTLFECELYLGYALTFGEREVRRLAEQNLEGCYQKRLLEAARFMWMQGAQNLLAGHWQVAIETFQRAAEKKEGWGWAVNYGDIWLGEASAHLVLGAERLIQQVEPSADESMWLHRVQTLLNRAQQRINESGAFGSEGHPWLTEIRNAIHALEGLEKMGADLTGWLADFKQRTMYWSAQILAGADPFPPRVKPRLEDADTLVRRLNAITQTLQYSDLYA